MPLNIVLGVGGGIAAYKAASLLRLLTEAGHTVRVVPTQSALRFVGAATWEALSGQPVTTSVWQDVPEVPHVTIGRAADLVIVAPATADLLAKAATGSAGDLLTNVLLTATCPVVFAPAMHTEMWLHPATQTNVATLRARGAMVIDPAVGRLTGSDSGPGRLPEPEHIAAVALGATRPRDLNGVTVVVTAGGTREYLDPVRYLGNRSSGRQGAALAQAAATRGATVTLIGANMEIAPPAGVHFVSVDTGEQMRQAVATHSRSADVIIMAAAVADYAPAIAHDHKMKKDPSGVAVHLVPTPDILAGLVADRRHGQLIVGFAAETGDSSATSLEHAQAKRLRKGCDFLVLNDVSSGKAFGTLDNEVVILSDTTQVHVPLADKLDVAHAIWDEVLKATDSGTA